jgi:hypothetical protein
VVDIIFITGNDTGGNKFVQSLTPKMTEMAMPQGGGCSEECRGAGGGCIERVEITGAIAHGDHVPGLQILHRKAKGIKLNGAIIVGGKMMNKN